MDQAGGDIWRGNVGMRVLQINSVCGYGSTGNIVVDLYHELKKQGHECCIAYGRGTAPDDVDSYRIGTDLDVYVHGVMSRLTDKHGFYSTHATKKFVKWMEEYNPDVIHLHNLHGYYINIEVLFEALKQMDKPVVWTLHDCWAFTGHCAYFDYVDCDKWKIQCKKCPQKKEYPTSYWLDNSRVNFVRKKNIICALRNLTVVTPSHWLCDLVKQSYLHNYRTTVIHNGIDLNTFQPTASKFRERYGLEGKTVILGVASEWTRRKGIQDFFRLSNMLDDSYRIVLIGHLDEKIRRVGNILYIERTTDRKELAAWYTTADVFFNPTYEDNYPTVNLEAQACGTPVITYDTGGSPEGLLLDSCVVGKDLLQAVKKIVSLKSTKSNQLMNFKEFSVSHMTGQYRIQYEMLERK